jgi:hypothetical protein
MTTRLLANGNFYNGGTTGVILDETLIQRSKYAVQFNGSSQYLSIPANSTLALGSSNFTIECWVYFNSVAANQTIIGQFIYNSSASWNIYTTSIGTLNYYFSTGGLTWDLANAVSIGSVTTGVWYHVALVRNGSTFTPYLNGVAGTTTTSSAAVFTSTPTFNIGAAGNPAAYFNGYISNVRILKGTALYTTSFLPPAAPLNTIANTVLLTCQSSTMTDNSTNAFTITNNGSAIIQSSVLPTHTTNRILPSGDVLTNMLDEVSITNNKYGVSFNGSSQYLSTPVNSALQLTGDFTVEAWIYPTTINTNNMIFGADNGAASDYFLITSTLLALAISAGSSPVYPSWSYNFVINQWYHVVVTRSSNILRAFVNGVQLTLAGGSATESRQWFQSGVSLLIGRYGYAPSPWYFTGYISNVRILKGTALYTTNFTPTAPLNPITNTVLLTCQSATIVDNSTNAFTITNNGSATVIQPALTYPSQRLLNDGTMIIAGTYDELTTFTTPTVNYLVVAGGGGGGGGSPYVCEGCGGGAGGLLSGTIAVTAGTTYSFVIGGGGGGGSMPWANPGGTGGNSTAFGLTTYGGGGGAGTGSGSSGGSGGGTWNGSPGSGYAGPPRQGYNGAGGGNNPGGGGGAGGSSPDTYSGGPGAEWPVGSGNYYAGGGGSTYGAGGTGGGASGGGSGASAASGTGGGGGGGRSSSYGGGGNGGSGIIIVRFESAYASATSTTGSPTFTNTGGYKTYTFTSSGSITI